MPVAAHRFDGMAFSTCPGNFFSLAALHFVELYSRFKDGVLPYGGTLTEQPSKLIEIFRTIEGHKAEREIESKERHEAKIRAANSMAQAR